MAKKPLKQQESEYNEILQQAVAVINETRISIARQLNASENTKLHLRTKHSAVRTILVFLV